jgi:hypothetical protein
MHEFLRAKDLIGELVIKEAKRSWQTTFEREVATVPVFAAPPLHTLHDFWLDCRGTSDVPNRDAFDPFNLRPWLGHISIYEAINDGADFRIRLEGTSIVAITGEDWTGRRASDVDRRYGSRLVDFMKGTIRTHQPAIHTMRLFQNNVEYITRLLLPIRSHPLGPVDQVFLVMYADPQQTA